jgi:D-glycero-D-manno-heptose 1,7-bisphosphate phosphatase
VSANARRTSELLAGVRLVIFDADGTLRRTTVPGQPCPHAEQEWELLPGVVECLTAVEWEAKRLAVGVASNQDHVGYGLLDAELARRMLRAMILQATNGSVTDPEIRFCPHRHDERCQCRKPAPGMLLDIMHTLRIAPRHTLYVGDAHIDQQAARAARVRFEWADAFFCNA